MVRLIFLTLCFGLMALKGFGQDSVRNELSTRSQAISSFDIKPADTALQVARYTEKLDSTKKTITKKIDSLSNLKLPTNKLQQSLDSLNKIEPYKTVKSNIAAANNASHKITGKVTSAENQINNKVASVINRGESSLPPTSIAAKIPAGANLPGVPGSMPPLNSPTVQVPGTQNMLPSISQENLPGINKNLQQEIPSVNRGSTDLNGLKNELPQNNVTKELGSASQLSQKAGGVTKDVSGVVKGDSASLKKVGSRIEDAAKNNKNIKDLATQDGKLSQYKNLAATGDQKQLLEKEALQQMQTKATNHFEGQQQILQSAMGKMADLKTKYAGLQSMANLPKRRNEMYGKPFLSRLIGGVNIQILKTGKYPTTDFNPWIAYRVTGHITAGGGWNERINYSHWRLQRHQKVYGPRVFAEFKIKEGVWLHTELETMNALVPPDQALVKDRFERKWVTNLFGGLKTEFKIYKSFKGYAQVLYNVNSVFANKHINLYGDPLTARIGFQLPFKKP